MSNLINGKQIKNNTISIGGVNNKLVSSGNFSMGTNGIQSSYVPTTNIDLINKLYLDNVINNITTESTTAGNGLTILGKTVKLGGTLTENTVVGGSSGTYSVAFGDGVSANNLNNFDVFTKVGGYINLQGGNASYILLNGNNDIDIVSTTLDISISNAIDISGSSIILSAGTAGVSVSSNAFKSVLKTTNLTSNRNFEFPNQSGTLALLSDIVSGENTTAGNGLSMTGGLVKLGGTLTDVNTSINLDNKQLRFVNGANKIISVDERQLFDTVGKGALSWDNRVLYDGSELNSIDWQDRILFDSTWQYSLEWQNRILYDGSGLTSINWQNRQLISTNYNTNFSWANKSNVTNSNFLNAELNFAAYSAKSSGNVLQNLSFANSNFWGDLQTTTLTANRTYTLPNTSGTLALLSDITGTPTFGSNGITKTGLTFELGGTLNKNTTIDSNAFILNFSGSNGIKYSADYSASYTDRTLVDKGYLDSTIAGAIEGLNVKQAARVASTSGLTLSGLQTIDGVTVIAGNRVLVKNQTLGEQNGIYIASSSGWVRSDDFNSGSEILNAFLFVSEGTTNADTGWVLTNNLPIMFGLNSLVFAQFSSVGVIQAGTGLTKVGNNLNVNVGNGIEIVGNNISVNLHSSSGLTFDSTDLSINATHSATVATNGSFVKIADNTNRLFVDFNDYQSSVVVSEVTSNNVTGSIGNSGASLSLSSVKLVGEPRFFVNGIMYKLGFNGTASNNLVFVSPNGSTVRTTLASIINGDNIYWNPLFANAFDLDTTDRLQLVYDTQNL